MRSVIQLVAVVLDWSKGIKESRITILIIAVMGMLAGFGNTILLALINSALLGTGGTKTKLVWEFASLCLIIPASGFISQLLLVRLAAQAARDLRLELSRQILAAPYSLIEELGPHRLLATITDDIPTATTAITSMPQLLTQFAVMGGCLVYLGWLSWPLLLLVLGYMLVGILSHQLPIQRSVRYFRLMRDQWDGLLKSIKALTEGSKELKLNRARRESFLTQQLQPVVDDLKRYGIQGNTLSVAASNWGQILFFIFIGLILFLAPLSVTVGRQTLVGYTLTVLFMITPLTIILNTIPTFGRAYVAAEKVKMLGLSLASHRPEVTTGSLERTVHWKRLDLIGVIHTYRQNGSLDEFVLGPLDLTFHPGELVFITGGNGSGKTTLAKLLMGLYEPSSGEIRLDGETVTLENRDQYRQYFSVVFADFYLFERLFGVDSHGLEKKADEYLRKLQLDGKVQIQHDKLSTIDLSQGQRRRLALLTAYLEDRPIYIFDEWASDQDPMFKQIFYYQILMELKARGKTVIVITHDDRYYEVADRLIKLERGKLEYDRRMATAPDASKTVAAPLV